MPDGEAYCATNRSSSLRCRASG